MDINLSPTQRLLEALQRANRGKGPTFAQVYGDVADFQAKVGIYGSPFYATDLRGREYFLPIEVVVGNDTIPGTSSTYADALGVTDANGQATGKWNLPYPVMSADMQKHIVDTELTERQGLVSELINIGGWKISVRGYIINESNEFPEDDYNTMVRLCSINKAVVVNNPLTDILLQSNGGAKTVTIRNLKWHERPGVKHVREYSLELWQDVPFNLIEIS